MAEGFITSHFISMAYQNTLEGYCDNEKEYCDKLNAFLKDNMKWINSQVKANPKSDYWNQVKIFYFKCLVFCCLKKTFSMNLN